MHTREVFYKPGIEPPEKIIEGLAEVPRPLHAAGVRFSVAWRSLVFVVATLVCGYALYWSFQIYLETASFIHWFIIIAVLPVWLGFLPWWLISSYRSKLKSFNYCKNIYQNGVPAIGTINALTRFTGGVHDSHHSEHKWASLLFKARVDYTFTVDNTIKTGTALLREQSIDYLSMNDNVCVLYLPENPSDNMIYPIPGYEFFDYLEKK
ncbi:MAG: hypothetical protein IJM59_03040 [Proteobacteria bacterium]|nr:hypothetical protein [Pseudomonadota bacterium]